MKLIGTIVNGQVQLDAKNPSGHTAIMFAALAGKAKMVELFL